MNRTRPTAPPPGRAPGSGTLSRRAALVGAAQAVIVLAAACTQLPAPKPSSQVPGATEPPVPLPSATLPAATPTADAACAAALPTVIPPTVIPYPGYVQVEPSTGLHVTADPQILDMATYRLVVKGKVGRELSLTYDELRCLPKISAHATIECPGFFVDNSNLAGASLASVLALAGPLEGANQVLLVGVDRRTEGIPLEEARGPDYFLAYEWEGEALPRSHGFPIRAALPGRTGGNWVKWLQEIEVV